MFDAQHDDPPSSSLACLTNSSSVAPVETASPCVLPESARESASVSQPAGMPRAESVCSQDESPCHQSQNGRGTGEWTDAGLHTSIQMDTSIYHGKNDVESPGKDGQAAAADGGGEASTPFRDVSFEEFALRYRHSRQKQAQSRKLERRLRATKVFMGLSARLVRTVAAVQRGLVECLKHEDKPTFVVTYNGLREVQESSEAVFRRRIGHAAVSARTRRRRRGDATRGPGGFVGDDDDGDSSSTSDDTHVDHPEPSPGFVHQMSPQSRADLLGLLSAARTDAQFLFERLRTLSQSQLAAIVSRAASVDAGDFAVLSPTSQSRNFYAAGKRNHPPSTRYQDVAIGLERTDCLSVLLFNVFAHGQGLDSEGPEARLRVDVWSSVCAKLLIHDSGKFYPLVGHVLSTLSVSSDWKAKSKFELYVMDVLQTGAFLLEPIGLPSGSHHAADALDPLRTDVAEEFFATAVDGLFDLLDDADAGFPRAIRDFASGVYAKLIYPESRDRFLEYLFVQWFFSKFLYGALTYPETHGMLLDFYISKDAREKLLGQVGLQAYSQVFAVLRSAPHVSVARPGIRQHIRNMLARFRNTSTATSGSVLRPSPTAPSEPSADTVPTSPSAFLLLSSTDVLTLLDGLFPRPNTSTIFATRSPSAAMPAAKWNVSRSARPGSGLGAEPGVVRTTFGYHGRGHANSPRPGLHSDMHFLIVSDHPWSRAADRIRFELSETGDLDERSCLDHPAHADWEIFSFTPNSKRIVWGVQDAPLPSLHGRGLPEDLALVRSGVDGNWEALQTAIVRLIDEEDIDGRLQIVTQDTRASQPRSLTLAQRFDRSALLCQETSDFMGAHYWWTASQHLRQCAAEASSGRIANDSSILAPMLTSCTQLLDIAQSAIGRCDTDLMTLRRRMQHLQSTVKTTMATVAKLRNKMWYVTDVKNSMRYEGAKHVSLALKNMIYDARIVKPTRDEGRLGSGARSLAGSFFQKSELQVMNVMKAPTNQGGPRKLSDEQVDLTRKWLSHNGIDNFCRGEERIHRFCYEVKSSIGQFVGETMAETPVLWSSELFQRERAQYEGPAPRHYVGAMSAAASVRPSSGGSDDAVSGFQRYSVPWRAPETLFRGFQGGEGRTLTHNPSFQSLNQDRGRNQRDLSATTDTSSIGGSPGRAASSSTGDSYSTFWSAPHYQPTYTISGASSVHSRPPSMLSEVAASSRRVERNSSRRGAFLDDLRQDLTSLLLSDLGSPVWSCGSETDAWFINALSQHRIQAQMEKRARAQRFYAEYEAHVRSRSAARSLSSRRSQSVEPRSIRHRDSADNDRGATRLLEDHLSELVGSSQFPYLAAFRRSMDVFSRQANPYIKLTALRDLQALVVSSLNLSPGEKPRDVGHAPRASRASACTATVPGVRRTRFSISQPPLAGSDENFVSHLSPAPGSAVCDSSPTGDDGGECISRESRIVQRLREVILEIKPKTLFRDLQFIAAFVPREILNKTAAGTAFLQFGLAALSLKEEVCHSMVEIADRIVSQELSRRHLSAGVEMYGHAGCAIRDAASLWIITAKEGHPVAQRELAILYLTHPELLPRVTLPLTLPRDTFKAEMMYRRDRDSKSDPQTMCLALHWMQLSASGGDVLAMNRLRERQEFEALA